MQCSKVSALELVLNHLPQYGLIEILYNTGAKTTDSTAGGRL